MPICFSFSLYGNAFYKWKMINFLWFVNVNRSFSLLVCLLPWRNRENGRCTFRFLWNFQKVMHENWKTDVLHAFRIEFLFTEILKIGEMKVLQAFVLLGGGREAFKKCWMWLERAQTTPLLELSWLKTQRERLRKKNAEQGEK